jgi:uracil-DNA glycosylase
VTPGEDYVISEVVHCKSRNEGHVNEVLDTCVKLYLMRLIECSTARIIVCMGKHAQNAVCKTYDFNQEDNLYGPVKIGKHDRHFVFLPHPNSRGKRTFKKSLHPKQLNQLREIIACD